MPDVLALPLPEAIKILREAGLDFQVICTSSPYRQEKIENCLMEEYIVRQWKLPGNIIQLGTMKKRRKEVHEHGFQN